jgi:hypothetical protein
MAKNTLQILLIFLFVPAAASLSFDVEVGQLTDHSFKDLEYKERVSTAQDVNASIENVGSIGCSYRAQVKFQQGERNFTRYSGEKPLWPGENARVQVKYIPFNYTGEIEAEVSLEYCDQTKKVEEFSFNTTENISVEEKVKSRTVKSTDRKALVEVEGELLVPQEAPVYWKTSSAKINDESAWIKYGPPIFEEKETITYTVLENGDIKGVTQVKLVSQPTLKEKIMDRKLEVFIVLLLISLVLNLVLVSKLLGLDEKLSLDYELPEFRKDWNLEPQQKKLNL